MTTDYPWDGKVRIRISGAPAGRWELALRVPHWAEQPTLTVNGTAASTAPADGWWVVGPRVERLRRGAPGACR